MPVDITYKNDSSSDILGKEIISFWESRLYDENGKKRQYDQIEFINGYNANARRMLTKYEGFDRKSVLFHIKVGKIVKRAK